MSTGDTPRPAPAAFPDPFTYLPERFYEHPVADLWALARKQLEGFGSAATAANRKLAPVRTNEHGVAVVRPVGQLPPVLNAWWLRTWAETLLSRLPDRPQTVEDLRAVYEFAREIDGLFVLSSARADDGRPSDAVFTCFDRPVLVQPAPSPAKRRAGRAPSTDPVPAPLSHTGAALGRNPDFQVVPFPGVASRHPALGCRLNCGGFLNWAGFLTGEGELTEEQLGHLNRVAYQTDDGFENWCRRQGTHLAACRDLGERLLDRIQAGIECVADRLRLGAATIRRDGPYWESLNEVSRWLERAEAVAPANIDESKVNPDPLQYPDSSAATVAGSLALFRASCPPHDPEPSAARIETAALFVAECLAGSQGVRVGPDNRREMRLSGMASLGQRPTAPPNFDENVSRWAVLRLVEVGLLTVELADVPPAQILSGIQRRKNAGLPLKDANGEWHPEVGVPKPQAPYIRTTAGLWVRWRAGRMFDPPPAPEVDLTPALDAFIRHLNQFAHLSERAPLDQKQTMANETRRLLERVIEELRHVLDPAERNELGEKMTRLDRLAARCPCPNLRPGVSYVAAYEEYGQHLDRLRWHVVPIAARWRESTSGSSNRSPQPVNAETTNRTGGTPMLDDTSAVPSALAAEQHFRTARHAVTTLLSDLTFAIQQATSVIEGVNSAAESPEMPGTHDRLTEGRERFVQAFRVGRTRVRGLDVWADLSPMELFRGGGEPPPRPVDGAGYTFEAVGQLAAAALNVGWGVGPNRHIRVANDPWRQETPAERFANPERWRTATGVPIPFLGDPCVRSEFLAALTRECDKAFRRLRMAPVDGIDRSRTTIVLADSDSLKTTEVQVGGNAGSRENSQRISTSVEQVTKPSWDEQTRTLTFGKWQHVYQRRSPSQERILAAFQDAGWPERVTKYLPNNLSGARRNLQDTLGDDCPITFQMDGTSSGIRWRPRSSTEVS